MQLVVIRHAIALEREAFAKTGEDDSLRPLTKNGKWQMQRVAKGLRAVVRSLDALGSSPFVRARDTAKIVAERYDGVEIDTVEALVPESRPAAFIPWLRAHDGASTVAVVGHEPHLGELVSWLLSGKSGHWIALKKGGACLLELEGRPRAGGATLLWMLTPSLLRRISD